MKSVTHSMENYENLFTFNLIKQVIDGPSDIIGETNLDNTKSEYFSETVMLLDDFFSMGDLRIRGYENGIVKKAKVDIVILINRSSRSMIVDHLADLLLEYNERN